MANSMTGNPIRLLLSIALLLVISCASSLSCQAAAQDSVHQTTEALPPRQLAVANFVTWWSHDATGYHPAIMARIENVSGTDLTGVNIRFQGRFTDTQNGYVTVAREEIRWDLRPNQQKTLTLRGPSNFELPIDYNSWPKMECKVMYRAGDVDDAGTQTLVLTKLENVTMTDEEAATSLTNRQDIIRRGGSRPDHHHVHTSQAEPAVPLSATALALNSKLNPRQTKITTSKNGVAKFNSLPKVAGLGDEFIDFEQSYEVPSSSDRDVHERGWTWVHYTKSEPHLDVYAGSKGLNSKADLIVVKIPASEVSQESQIVEIAKAMAGKMRTQLLDHPKKSVKYLPNGGRFLITTMDAPGYRFFYINPRGASAEDNNYVFAMSRLTGDLRTMMPDLMRKSPMMRFLSVLLGDEQN